MKRKFDPAEARRTITKTEIESALEILTTGLEDASLKERLSVTNFIHCITVGKDKIPEVRSDLNKAFRKQSLKVHPDKNKDPDATTAFKQFNAVTALLNEVLNLDGKCSYLNQDYTSVFANKKSRPDFFWQNKKPEEMAFDECWFYLKNNPEKAAYAKLMFAAFIDQTIIKSQTYKTIMQKPIVLKLLGDLQFMLISYRFKQDMEKNLKVMPQNWADEIVNRFINAIKDEKAADDLTALFGSLASASNDIAFFFFQNPAAALLFINLKQNTNTKGFIQGKYPFVMSSGKLCFQVMLEDFTIEIPQVDEKLVMFLTNLNNLPNPNDSDLLKAKLNEAGITDFAIYYNFAAVSKKYSHIDVRNFNGLTDKAKQMLCQTLVTHHAALSTLNPDKLNDFIGNVLSVVAEQSPEIFAIHGLLECLSNGTILPQTLISLSADAVTMLIETIQRLANSTIENKNELIKVINEDIVITFNQKKIAAGSDFKEKIPSIVSEMYGRVMEWKTAIDQKVQTEQALQADFLKKFEALTEDDLLNLVNSISSEEDAQPSYRPSM